MRQSCPESLTHDTPVRQELRSTLFPLESQDWKFKIHRVGPGRKYSYHCARESQTEGLTTAIVGPLAVSLTFSRHWARPLEGSGSLKCDHRPRKCVTIINASILQMEELRHRGRGVWLSYCSCELAESSAVWGLISELTVTWWMHPFLLQLFSSSHFSRSQGAHGGPNTLYPL